MTATDALASAIEAALIEEGEFDGPCSLRGFMVIYVADAIDGDEASEYAGFMASSAFSIWEKIGLLHANLTEQLAKWEHA